MKLVDKIISENKFIFNKNKFQKKSNESKRMFVKRLASILFEYIDKNMFLNLDDMSIFVKDDRLLMAILKEISFDHENYHTYKKKNNISVYSKNHKKWKQNILIINAISFARNLQDMPQNILTPNNYVDIINEEFSQNSLLEDKDILSRMRLFNAVGNSSKFSQKFVILKNKTKNKNEDNPVVLIGKGITYDSGGYNLKNGKNLLGMKADMSGSAVMIAIMKIFKDLKIPKNIIAVIPLASNDLSKDSIQPQMVIKSFDGTYVEIKNTDAEGRLIIADAISYAVENISPSLIIEASTLTGSITSTLDNLSSALFTNRYEIGEQFILASKKTTEKFTLFKRYKEVISRLHNSSLVADIANTDMKEKTSSLYAFEFLNYFSKNTPFIHLDIAGTSVLNRQKGTGESIISIFEFLSSLN